MNNYTIYNIFNKETETYNIKCSNIDEVNDWIKNNLKLTYSWTISSGDKRENFKLDTYKVTGFSSIDGDIKVNKTSTRRLADGFLTKEEAIKDYKKCREIARPKLERIEKELKSLQERLSFDIDYNMEGDTYGIHDSFQHVNIKEGRYSFYKKIAE